MAHTLADIQSLDRNDPLAPFRDRFSLPEGVIYFDGNSLGALPRGVRARMDEVVATQWGEGLIRSWNTHDWIDLPGRVGDRIGQLVGAAPGTVTVADSTSVNLFKALGAALRMRPGRRVILTEAGNFPTDAYVAAGIAELMGQGHELRLVAAGELAASLGPDVAVLMVTEVNYRTGARLDMASLTAAAHAAGALTIWDLCHSAGAFPVDLTAADADFAVGCGYKYLNGGPGAPAFIYAGSHLLADLRQPLTGWLGHAAPFTFAETYRPAAAIGREPLGHHRAAVLFIRLLLVPSAVAGSDLAGGCRPSTRQCTDHPRPQGREAADQIEKGRSRAALPIHLRWRFS